MSKIALVLAVGVLYDILDYSSVYVDAYSMKGVAVVLSYVSLTIGVAPMDPPQ